jgi:isoleucyl-tRNA synthetase
MQMLQVAAKGEDIETAGLHIEQDTYDLLNAELKEIKFQPFPHNDDFEIDLHRPYIDEIKLEEDGTELERVPDVFDCWFESGSMPYAQHHYPFVGKEEFEREQFPAQFIAEGLDQTRGWFYSLLVLGAAIFDKSPYENVIVNGLVLAEDGKKMSKSLQNYPDPMELADRVGIDAMRFYLLSSPIVKSEDLNFSEKEVLELQRKNIGRLHNVLAMFEMYSDDTPPSKDSKEVLDVWILNRLNQLVEDTTSGYRHYELDKATRPITDFIDDLSVWYLRRSRDRLKGQDIDDKRKALGTLRYTLRTLALVMAPVMPFYAEYLWRSVRASGDAESVHLGAWPEAGAVDEIVLSTMNETREIVTAALELRAKANIKVRQPLLKLTIGSGVVLADEYKEIVMSEVNIKEVVVDKNAEELVDLDTQLTPELKVEGAVREVMRAVQSERKKEGLLPQDEIEITIGTDENGRSAIETHKEMLMQTVGATKLTYEAVDGEKIRPDGFELNFKIKKI